MSYLVLARKWRPTQFAEVTGQEHVTKTLTNAIRLNRVAHSFLFTGARGVGKTSTARILAKALNCSKGPTTEPCESCASCQEIPEGRSLDVLEIDGASNRGIGEIRELRDGVRYAPSRDKHKIYIIDEVHMLTQEAFNALLKTLEEPPAHVIFIFATTEPQKIPVTILSRCQRFDFKRVPARVLIGRLSHILDAEGIKMEEGGLHLVARESEGSVRDALSLLDRIIASGGENITAEEVSTILGVADRRWLHQLMGSVFAGDAAKTIEVIHEVNHYGYDLKHFAHELVHFMRDLLVIRLGGTSAEKVTDLAESEFQAIQTLSQLRNPEDLERLLKVSIQGIKDLTHAPYPQIVLEAMVVRMASLRPLRPMDDLIKRLMILERALPEGAVIPPLHKSEGHLLAENNWVNEQGASQVAQSVGETGQGTASQREITSPSQGMTASVELHEESEPDPEVLEVVATEPEYSEPERREDTIAEVAEVTEVEMAEVPSPSIPALNSQPVLADAEALSKSHESPPVNRELDGVLAERASDKPVEAEVTVSLEETPAAQVSMPELEEQPPLKEELKAEPTEPIGVPHLQVVPEVSTSDEVVQEHVAIHTSDKGLEALNPFLEWLLNEDPALAGQLAQGKLELTSGSLAVRFRSNLFTGRFEVGTSSRELLESRLSAFFKDPVSIEVGQLLERADEDETRYEEDERKLQEKYAARRIEVKEMPLVSDLASTFEGEVVQVRLKGIDD